VISVFLAFTLAAAPRGPLAGRGADFAVLIRSPKDALPPLRAFLERASAFAPALSPNALGSALGQPLGVDLLDAPALASAGVDVAAPITLSEEKGATVVCLAGRKPLADGLRREAARAGPVEARFYGGARLEGTASGGSAWRAGFASKGTQHCFAWGAGALAALKSAVDAMGGAGLAESRSWASAARELDGPVLAFLGASGLADAAAALRPGPLRLAARGRWSGAVALSKPREGEPLLGWSAAAPFVASAKLAPAGWSDPPKGVVARALVELGAAACPRKDPEAARALWEALKGRQAGPLGLIVAGIDPSAAGEPHGKLFLFRQAWAAPLKDGAQAVAALRAALEKLRAAGARVEPEPGTGEEGPYRIAVGARSLFVGARGGALVLANDPGARDLAFSALGVEARGAAHAAQLSLDGPRAAAALSRVSLLDAARSPEMGALFAASIEAGALLKAAGTVALWAEPDAAGGTFEAELSLPP
jgi:hypothetical protein